MVEGRSQPAGGLRGNLVRVGGQGAGWRLIRCTAPERPGFVAVQLEPGRGNSGVGTPDDPFLRLFWPGGDTWVFGRLVPGGRLLEVRSGALVPSKII